MGVKHMGKKGELHCMQVRERESCDLRSTNQIMGLPCSSPTAGAVTSDTSDIRLTGLYHGDHKYESVRHLNFQLPDWNHVESTTITTRETVRQTDRSVHCQRWVHRSEWLGRSLSLFLSLSRSLSPHGTYAVLLVGLWRKIPVALSNPKFLVAGSLCSFSISLSPTVILEGWRRWGDGEASSLPSRAGHMASNSIFDTFASYSPSLLRGKSPIVAFPSLLLRRCGDQKAVRRSRSVHKSVSAVVCCESVTV